VPNPLLEPMFVRDAAQLRTIEEALAHLQIVRTAETGPGDHWISIAFEIARRERDLSGHA
jgi:hypothetical protein